MFGHPDETVSLVDILLHDLGALVCRLLGYFIFNYSLKDITYPKVVWPVPECVRPRPFSKMAANKSSRNHDVTAPFTTQGGEP